jgi:hypothetical protein
LAHPLPAALKQGSKTERHPTGLFSQNAAPQDFPHHDVSGSDPQIQTPTSLHPAGFHSDGTALPVGWLCSATIALDRLGSVLTKTPANRSCKLVSGAFSAASPDGNTDACPKRLSDDSFIKSTGAATDRTETEGATPDKREPSCPLASQAMPDTAHAIHSTANRQRTLPVMTSIRSLLHLPAPPMHHLSCHLRERSYARSLNAVPAMPKSLVQIMPQHNAIKRKFALIICPSSNHLASRVLLPRHRDLHHYSGAQGYNAIAAHAPVFPPVHQAAASPPPKPSHCPPLSGPAASYPPLAWVSYASVAALIAIADHSGATAKPHPPTPDHPRQPSKHPRAIRLWLRQN